jgi:plasmid stabilization system protein ParE
VARFHVRLSPGVEREIAEAMYWYSRAPGLEFVFRDAVNEVIDSLAETPARFRVVQDDVRRVILRRFPYALFFVIEGAEVIVLACVHERRSPDLWPTR